MALQAEGREPGLTFRKQTYEAQVLWGMRGFQPNGKVLVVCTDVEHGEQIDTRLVELSRGADLLVHDAQDTAEELKRQSRMGTQ